MTTAVIAVIGCGHMGNSLLNGLIKSGYPKNKIIGADPSQDKLDLIKKSLGIHVTQDNQEAASLADVLIFAIKPQFFKHVARSLSHIAQKKHFLIISVAAGIKEETIQHAVGGQLAIVRTMPNMPALIACGITALYANQFVTPKQKNLAASIMRAVGDIIWIEDEQNMDIVTALSGSGPAYFFLIMEALENAAHELGLSKAVAHQLTIETALGSAYMAKTSQFSLVELRQQVASPGGTTEKAIQVFEELGLRDLFRKALEAAKLHAETLGKK